MRILVAALLLLISGPALGGDVVPTLEHQDLCGSVPSTSWKTGWVAEIPAFLVSDRLHIHGITSQYVAVADATGRVEIEGILQYDPHMHTRAYRVYKDLVKSYGRPNPAGPGMEWIIPTGDFQQVFLYLKKDAFNLIAVCKG